MFIGGVARPGAVRGAPPRRGSGPASFKVPEARAAAAETANAASAIAMPPLLAMQEAESAALQDRDARRHGEALMEELTGLQRALLGGREPDLDRLAALAERKVGAADPALAGVMRAIQLRAGIELARSRSAASA